MEKIKSHNLFKFRTSVGIPAIAMFIILGLIVTFIFSVITYNKKYRDRIEMLNSRLSQIQGGFIKSLTNSLWKLDDEQTQIILESILRQQDIERVRIIDQDEVLFDLGNRVNAKNMIHRIYPLIIEIEEEKRYIGDLEVYATTKIVKEDLAADIKFDSFIELIKAFLFSVFGVFLIKFLITRHIDSISEFFVQNNIYKSQKKLVLNRSFEFWKKSSDNFDQLVQTINDMIEQLHFELQDRKKAEEELTKVNKELEKRVEQKTRELLESDRIEAVVEMSAGIAHEINSPLSVVYSINKRLKKLADKKEVDHSKLEVMTTILDNSVERIFSITRAMQTLSQVSDEEFGLEIQTSELIEESLKGISEIFKSSIQLIKYDVKNLPELVSIDERLFYQMLYMLFYIRADKFEDPTNESWINLDFSYTDHELVITCYDNARKLTEAEKEFIIHPFKSREQRDRGSLLLLGTFSGLVNKMGAKINFIDYDHDIFLQIRIPERKN